MRTRLFVLLTCFAVTACAAAELKTSAVEPDPVAGRPTESTAPASPGVAPDEVFHPLPQMEELDRAIIGFSVGNRPETRQAFRPLAEAGNARAQYYLGRAYAQYGYNTPLDRVDCEGRDKNGCLAEGIFWLRKAAAQGLAPAQYWLGHYLGLGRSWTGKAPSDKAEAAYWLRLAARQRFAPAMNRLAEDAAAFRFRFIDRIEARMWAYLYERYKIPRGNFPHELFDVMARTAPHVTPEQDAEARRRAEAFRFDHYD